LYSIGNRIFDFTARILESDTETSVLNFDEPLRITIQLTDDEQQAYESHTLGAYWYNAGSDDWEYIGGLYNEDSGELTFMTDHFSLYSVMSYQKSFSDISNHWARTDIEKMASRHITNGKGDNIFDPNSNTSRAEFTALVVRSVDAKLMETESIPYGDVLPSKWYYNEVETAYANGLIKAGATFTPEADISREGMMAIISEALVYAGTYDGISSSEEEEILSQFDDSMDISEANRTAVALVIKNGIINGRTLTQIAPMENATRAETMVVVSRLLKIIEETLYE